MPKKPRWNEAPCPECKEPVAVEARRCPHCQAVYTPQYIDERKKQHSRSQKFGFGCLAILAVLLIAMCSVGETEDANTGSEKTGSSKHSDSEATISPDDTDHWPKAGTASPALVAAVKELHDGIMGASASCDAASKNLADIAGGLTEGRTSVYDGYGAANRSEDACRSSWTEMGDVAIPAALTGTIAEQAEKTRDVCRDAMLAKQMGASTMQEVFDGNFKPSKMQEMQEQANAAQAGTLACVANLFTVAGMAGVDPKVMGGS